jgi:excinuclease ABC subunit C
MAWQEQIKKLPDNPGCYVFKDSQDHTLYVGKAKNLKKRVTSYARTSGLDAKTFELTKHIKSIEYFVTGNETEALLLEANLIRERQPKYNLDLKGGRRYAYILLTNEPYPRLLTARNTSLKGEYYGPFVSGALRNSLLHTLRKTFFIRTCNKLPRKPCLRYHIGLCKAPCAQLQSIKEYSHNVERVREFLQGKNKEVATELKNRMKLLSEREEYEHAREVRDQLRALEYLQEQQLVERDTAIHEDVMSYVQAGDEVYVLVFNVRNGVLGEQELITIPYSDDFFDEFLRRYYEEQGSSIPKLVLVPHIVGQDTQDYLSHKAGRAIEFRVPQKGSRKELLELVNKNLHATTSAASIAATQFQEFLGLPTPVRTIECFDISHLQGTNVVGSMVRFVDGNPSKKEYRRFKIRTVEGSDDVRSLKEIVRRRYKRLIEEGKTLPDLIVIDGGPSQLSFAQQALEEVGATETPIISLAKKNEEVFVPGGRLPRRFDKKLEMMKVLIAARDEAHRFGLKYHQLLRSKQALE